MAINFWPVDTCELMRIMQRRIDRRRDPAGVWIMDRWGINGTS